MEFRLRPGVRKVCGKRGGRGNSADRGGFSTYAATRRSPQPIRTAPSGALSRRHQGMFFYIPISIPRTSIQPRFPNPTANIRSINDQQQPTQKIP